MATNGTGLLNISDYAKAVDPSGKILPVVDTLSQENEIINDMPVPQSNMPTGEMFLQSTEEPTVEQRIANRGTLPSKGDNKQVFEGFATSEVIVQVDRELIPDQAIVQQIVAQQLKKGTSAMGKGMTKSIFYGNRKESADKFDGFSVRLSDKTLPNVVNAAGSGDYLTSIYLIVWDAENGCYGFAPKGSTVGITHLKYNGGNLTEWHDSNDIKRIITGYMHNLNWKLGLACKDLRQCGRLANIALGSITDANILKQTRTVANMINNLSAGRACWYMNRYAKDRVEQALDAKSNAHYTVSQTTGEGATLQPGIRMLHGIPIRVCDQILGNGTSGTGETAVSFS